MEEGTTVKKEVESVLAQQNDENVLTDEKSSEPCNNEEPSSAAGEGAEYELKSLDDQKEEPTKEATEKHDDDAVEGVEYAYLNRPGFSSEQFKIEIMNLPKHYGAGQLKKFLSKLGINIHKLKMMGNYVFTTFRSEEERQQAMEKLKGCKYKGKILDVKLAKPMKDPLVKKRKAAEADDGEGEKKPKIDEPSVQEQVTKKASPFAGKPYEEQLQLKKQDMVKVLTTLTREVKKAHYQIKHYIRQQMEANDGLICPLSDVVPSPVLEKYRNKCDFTIGINPESDELTVGFRVSSYKAGSCAVGPIAHISFIPDSIKAAVLMFEAHFRASGRKPFDPEDHSGFWRQLLLRTNLEGEVLAIVMVHPQDLKPEEMDQVKADLRKLVEGTRVVSLYFQPFERKKADEEPFTELLAGAPQLVEKMCDLNFSISPLAFFQVNTAAAEVLYNKIAELAELDHETDLLDVCCGTGSIGLSLAKKCRRIFGVEMIASAVEDAKRNAENNGLTNCLFVAGKAEDELDFLIKKIEKDDGGEGEAKGNKKTVAVVDPPRAGLPRRGCQLLRTTPSIKRLIYVSCNAEAAMKSFVDLCRAESNAFGGVPFVPVKALPVDLFPDTPHCELILVLERYQKT